MPQVGVVIPYYQREPALLRRALESVLAQQLGPGTEMHIIVVDDESPSPPDVDLRNLEVPAHCRVSVLRQENAGPGAARNRALDQLDPTHIQYIAFLDSDDSWHPHHLSTALAQLKTSDFYFCNCQTAHERDHFREFEYFALHHTRTPDGSYIPPQRSVTAIEMFNALIGQCFAHTSQVVYRYAAAPTLRFATDQGRAGEDLLFWLELLQSCQAVSYSTVVGGDRGWGVSIYRDTVAWDSEHLLDRLIDGLNMLDKVAQLQLNHETRQLVRQRVQSSRDEMLLHLVRSFRKRPRSAWSALSRISRERPADFISMPASGWRLPAHIRALREASPTSST